MKIAIVGSGNPLIGRAGAAICQLNEADTCGVFVAHLSEGREVMMQCELTAHVVHLCALHEIALSTPLDEDLKPLALSEMVEREVVLAHRASIEIKPITFIDYEVEMKVECRTERKANKKRNKLAVKHSNRHYSTRLKGRR